MSYKLDNIRTLNLFVENVCSKTGYWKTKFCFILCTLVYSLPVEKPTTEPATVFAKTGPHGMRVLLYMLHRQCGN